MHAFDRRTDRQAELPYNTVRCITCSHTAIKKQTIPESHRFKICVQNIHNLHEHMHALEQLNLFCSHAFSVTFVTLFFTSLDSVSKLT